MNFFNLIETAECRLGRGTAADTDAAESAFHHAAELAADEAFCIRRGHLGITRFGGEDRFTRKHSSEDLACAGNCRKHPRIDGDDKNLWLDSVT